MNVMFSFQKFQECKNDSHLHCMTHVFNAGTSFSLMRNSSSGECYHRNLHSIDKGKSLSFVAVKQSLKIISLESLTQLSFRHWTSCTTRRDTAIPKGSSRSPWRSSTKQSSFLLLEFPGLTQQTASSKQHGGHCHICMEISSKTPVSQDIPRLVQGKMHRYSPETLFLYLSFSCSLQKLFLFFNE